MDNDEIKNEEGLPENNNGKNDSKENETVASNDSITENTDNNIEDAEIIATAAGGSGNGDSGNDDDENNGEGLYGPHMGGDGNGFGSFVSGRNYINIEEDMKASYIDYAMSVIIGRALPDVRDGLKPVHRRVLYAMYDQGITSHRAYVKSARTVGEVLGKYHPHGDTAVYDTLVRMAQDFSLRYPLIDGQGNFGSVDGDSPAAMRYTEARLATLSDEMLRDLDKDTIDWMPNFDGSLNEPVVLPSKFPNLLVNGSSGIAVGMATNMPSHNLSEVIDGMVAYIDNPEMTLEEIMNYIPGPDFATGGIIMGKQGILEAYQTGRGSITVRAVVKTEDMGKGRERIVVTELPYQVNKAKLVVSIADLMKDKRIDGITDLRDESSREGMRVCIELRKGVNTDVILNQLYKHTQMQTTFGVINLVLDDNRPKVYGLKDLMRCYVEHCIVVITRRTQFELRKAEERAHILEGLTIALDNLDDVIKIIRESESPETAKTNLMESFALSDKQAQAILDMRLQRLTGLERDKIEAEYHETLALIEKLKGILASDAKIREIIKSELVEIKEKYGDIRRTQITESSAEKLNIEDLMQEEDIIITLTKNGYVKRMSPNVFRQIGRGSKGSNVMGVKDEDVVEHMFLANTHSYLLVFTSIGKVHWIKGYQIPEGGRQASGRAIVNLLQFAEGENLTAIMPVRNFDDKRKLFMVTRKGIAKMVMLSDFSRPTTKGIIAIKLDDGDELIAVKPIHGGEQVVLATRKGYAIRFPESEIRVMGRAARGVKAITFRSKDDEVVGMEAFTKASEDSVTADAQVTENGEVITIDDNNQEVVAEVAKEETVPETLLDVEQVEEIEDDGAEEGDVADIPEDNSKYEGTLLTVSSLGFGKKTDINSYRVTHRGGKGVINLKIVDKTGEVLAIKRMFSGDELMVVTTNGKVVRLSSDSIRNTGRAASGVKLITLDNDDRLISVVRIPSKEEKVD